MEVSPCNLQDLQDHAVNAWVPNTVSHLQRVPASRVRGVLAAQEGGSRRQVVNVNAYVVADRCFIYCWLFIFCSEGVSEVRTWR